MMRRSRLNNNSFNKTFRGRGEWLRCMVLFFCQWSRRKQATTPQKSLECSIAIPKHIKPRQKNRKCTIARLDRGTRFGTDCGTLLGLVQNGSCLGTCYWKTTPQLRQSVSNHRFKANASRPNQSSPFVNERSDDTGHVFRLVLWLAFVWKTRWEDPHPRQNVIGSLPLYQEPFISTPTKQTTANGCCGGTCFWKTP